MPAAKKAAAGAAATKKTASASTHASYKDMIKDAILNLKERNGSSRQAIKKYVRNNNDIKVTSEQQFDHLFNKALRTGVEKAEFTQPKGTSGPVKLAKKESKPAEKKTPTTTAKKETKDTKEAKPKATATKKAVTKKTDAKTTTTTTKKAPAVKKAAATTKAKPNTAKPRTKTVKSDAPAPAAQDTPTVLKKTKSGRVTKPATATAKKPATKKAAPKKAATKKADSKASS